MKDYSKENAKVEEAWKKSGCRRVVEFFNPSVKEWMECDIEPIWSHHCRYRLRPMKKKMKFTAKLVMAPKPECAVVAVIAERGKVYGDPKTSHENIGLAWTGLIQQHYGIKLDHPLPSWLVALMMVQFKVSRSAKVFKADNYLDLQAYAKFAKDFQQ